MPRCVGLPNGPCPNSRNDSSVRNGEGDLWLCADCDKTRHKEWLASRADKSTTTVSTTTATTSTTTKKTKITDTKPSQSRSADTFKPCMTEAKIVCASDSLDNISRFVCNELLAYVYCYRDSSNADALRRVVLNYFSDEDITVAKKVLCHEFQSALANTPSSVLLTERRSSTSRPAHEAEAEDIVGIFDALDVQNILHNQVFVATNLAKVPKYGPEETNIAAVVDRQVETESRISKLACNIDKLQHEVLEVSSNQTVEALSSINKKLESLSNAVTGYARGIGASVGSTSASTSSYASLPNTRNALSEPDRSMNLIVFGIAEDHDPVIWRSKVDAALSFVTGQVADVVDMYRLGRKTDSKVRPILVKLRTIWDRRIILSQSYKLKQYGDPVFIAPDEPLEARRKRIFDRKKAAAERAGKIVEVKDNVLVIDGIEVYSVKDGAVSHDDDQ